MCIKYELNPSEILNRNFSLDGIGVFSGYGFFLWGKQVEIIGFDLRFGNNSHGFTWIVMVK